MNTTLKSEPIALEEAERVINDYGVVLAAGIAGPGVTVDTRFLPHPKQRIKEAIVFTLRSISDAQLQEQFKVAYLSLSDWQDGVGDNPVGINAAAFDSTSDPLELARHVARQASESVRHAQKSQDEMETLRLELQELGLW